MFIFAQEIHIPPTAETVSKIESSTRQCGDCSDPSYRQRKEESVDASRGGPVETIDRSFYLKWRVVLGAKRQNSVGALVEGI